MNPHHIDADPDSTYYPDDADPDSDSNLEESIQTFSVALVK